MQKLYPMALQGVCQGYVWGGHRLQTLYGKGGAQQRTAESWELSCHPKGLSRVLNGEWAGATLRDCLGAEGESFPLLVKLLDAAEDLSVQVHPSAENAQAGECAKSEMWLILDAKPGSGLYCGLQRPVSRRELRAATEAGRITELLQRYSAAPGDVFHIPAGTIHGLGGGILAAEVQQSSDTTFRLYDYGRGRELHIERGCAAASLLPTPQPPKQPRRAFPGYALTELYANEFFRAERLECETGAPLETKNGFLHILLLSGQGTLYCKDEEYPMAAGSSWFLPAGLGECRAEGAFAALLTRE